MSVLHLWHGSSQIIERPVYGTGSAFNDYGRGFYCTENADLAKEWACTEQRSGFANHYLLNCRNLTCLDLRDSKYCILHWLALLATHRKFQPETAVAERGLMYLKQYFLIDADSYDLIRGYRADDSYFSFARAFFSNTISLHQLARAMYLGDLGEQIVLKSNKAFQQISFLEYVEADHMVYYRRKRSRDEDARAAYKREAMKNDLDGLFMRDILKEEIKADDERLRPGVPV